MQILIKLIQMYNLSTIKKILVSTITNQLNSELFNSKIRFKSVNQSHVRESTK
jgi:hypothetical protein